MPKYKKESIGDFADIHTLKTDPVNGKTLPPGRSFGFYSRQVWEIILKSGCRFYSGFSRKKLCVREIR